MTSEQSLGQTLAFRWMRGFRNSTANSEPRLAWEHPEDVVKLLNEVFGQLPVVGEPDELPVSPRELEETIRRLERMRMAAWLHDVLEDGTKGDGTRVTADDLRSEGVPEIVVLDVITLSHREGEDKVVYLARLSGSNTDVLRLKLLDRICNLREGSQTFKDARWARYVGETRKYILPLVDELPGSEADLSLRTLIEEALSRRAVVQ